MLAFYLSALETQEDKDKFECLYTKYAALLKHVAYEKLHDSHLAEDAVHNAFLNIIKSFCTIEEVDSHKTKRFLVVVTENAAVDILRKKNRVPQVDYEEVEPFLSVTPDMLDRVSAQELAQKIAAMPDIYRTVLELRVYHGLNDKQIAATLDISGAAVRKRLERARADLATALLSEEGALV